MSQPASTAITPLTREAHDEAVASDGFVVYDELTGPDLDPDSAAPSDLPLRMSY